MSRCLARWMPSWWWAAVLLAALHGAAQAASAAAPAPGSPQREPSDALACLTPDVQERAAVAYPAAAFRSGTPGQVQVELRFGGPDIAPALRVLTQQGDDSFVDAVREAVRSWRVPCQDRGAEPARLVFDFVFQPLTAKPAVTGDDADAAARQAMQACMRHVSGQKAPNYPHRALEASVQGRVVAMLRFVAPDQPPQARVLHSRGNGEAAGFSVPQRDLVRAVANWVQGYRMPCLEGGPLNTSIVFVFLFGGESYGFKPGLTLRELLPMVRNIRLQRLDMDFNTMGCPFDVKFQYRQPGLPNGVWQLDSHVPARQPFIDWLRQSQLDLAPELLDSIFGDTTVLHIPCVHLNLNPQGVSS